MAGFSGKKAIGVFQGQLGARVGVDENCIAQRTRCDY
jgi:hypothetical protein